MIKRILLWVIKIYQNTLSLDHGYLGKVFPNRRNCKFTPTCSEYSYEAINKYGAIKGGIMGLKRVIRCNPWAVPGQYDPVPEISAKK
jgi:putative membrane protein insertion efficiency factor